MKWMIFTCNSNLLYSIWSDEIQEWYFGVEKLIEKEQKFFKDFAMESPFLPDEEAHARWCFYQISRWAIPESHL